MKEIIIVMYDNDSHALRGRMCALFIGAGWFLEKVEVKEGQQCYLFMCQR